MEGRSSCDKLCRAVRNPIGGSQQSQSGPAAVCFRLRRRLDTALPRCAPFPTRHASTNVTCNFHSTGPIGFGIVSIGVHCVACWRAACDTNPPPPPPLRSLQTATRNLLIFEARAAWTMVRLICTTFSLPLPTNNSPALLSSRTESEVVGTLGHLPFLPISYACGPDSPCPLIRLLPC